MSPQPHIASSRIATPHRSGRYLDNANCARNNDRTCEREKAHTATRSRQEIAFVDGEISIYVTAVRNHFALGRMESSGVRPRAASRARFASFVRDAIVNLPASSGQFVSLRQSRDDTENVTS